MFLWLGEDGKAGAVVCVVLDRWRHDVHAVLADAARSLAMAASLGILRWQGVPPRRCWRHGPPLCLGQVLVEPALALRKGLRVGGTTVSMPSMWACSTQEVMAHEQAGFANDEERSREQQVQGARHAALGAVLHRHHPEIGGTGGW